MGGSRKCLVNKPPARGCNAGAGATAENSNSRVTIETRYRAKDRFAIDTFLAKKRKSHSESAAELARLFGPLGSLIGAETSHTKQSHCAQAVVHYQQCLLHNTTDSAGQNGGGAFGRP